MAVAVAIAQALGVPGDAIAKRLATLPVAPNRRAITRGSTGATFIDDTYNSNPAGAAAALGTLEREQDPAPDLERVLERVGLVRRQHRRDQLRVGRRAEIDSLRGQLLVQLEQRADGPLHSLDGLRNHAPGQRGAELLTCEADVTDVDTSPYDAVFVDPARRGGRPGGAAHSASARGGGRATGGRIFDPEAYSPPLSWAVETARKAPRAALKIAPGIPHDAVPDEAEAEWISDGGDVKEAVLWFGGDAPGSHRATLLPSGDTLASPLATMLPDPDVRAVGRFLYEPDGAVIRAHLVAEVAARVGGGLIDETIAYVTSDAAVVTPYASAYEITDQLPFNVKKLKALLRERGVGILTVKKRGSAVEPEELRRKVKPQGPGSATVFLTRVGGAPTMLVGHPVG